MTEEFKPTQDVPVAESKAEGQKIEWGPELGKMTANRAIYEVDVLNKNLPEGENKWRLPSIRELLTEFKKTESTPSGFEDDYYWSGDPNHNSGYALKIISMRDGDIPYTGSDRSHNNVRIVRYVA